jgi:hypothetical protein
VCCGHSASCVGTLLQHTKGKSAGWLTHVSSPADLSCPSWARTRTLLIQSPLDQTHISDNLLGFGHFPSIGARFPAVVCPLVPGETTAKLRLSSVRQALASPRLPVLWIRGLTLSQFTVARVVSAGGRLRSGFTTGAARLPWGCPRAPWPVPSDPMRLPRYLQGAFPCPSATTASKSDRRS